jgi:probable phosphoglycerate mutase
LSSTRFLLLRHAAHDLAGRALAGRMPGLGINAAGRAQAQALVAPLAALGIDAVYCSPQQRTRETAAPLAAHLGLPIGIAPGFDEIDFGDWTGRGFEELRASHGAAWTQWVERRSQATPPGGEPFADVPRRACAELDALRLRHPGATVLIVSHADVIKAVLAAHLGMSLDALERFDVECAGLSVIDAGEGWSRVQRINAALA